jgi:esterase
MNPPLHFQAVGRGEPLVVLHGLFGSLENWAGISRRLGEHFEVFALDLRNHGRSPHLPDMDYPSMAGDVLDWMGGRNLARVSLLGHSMGGKTAMQLALQHPEAVRKLVVVDIAPRAYAPRHREILDALLTLDVSAYQNRLQMEEALAPAIPDRATRQFLLKNVGRDGHGAFFWKMNLPAIARSYDQLNQGLMEDHIFDGPALFVLGGQSDYVQPEDKPRIQRLFPRATFRTLATAGHWVHSEAPHVFVEAVLEFLASPESTGG